jgi:hypothetical protein
MNDGVAIEESCRRCGARVVGALDAENRGVYLEAGQPVVFRNVMPFAGPEQKRHQCPKEKR